MIHIQDRESLGRMFGMDDVPRELEAECEARLKMFHIDGNSGPLGSLALISMARGMGYQPANIEVAREAVDWKQQPADGTTRVEANYFGTWAPGVFLGFVESGTLAVKLDNDATVRECRPDMVRLIGHEPVAEDVDPVPAVAALLEQTPESKKAPHRKPKPVTPPPPRDDGPKASPADWLDIEPKSRVLVDVDGEPVEGAFMELLDDNSVWVWVDGEDGARSALPDAVTYTGPPQPPAEKEEVIS